MATHFVSPFSEVRSRPSILFLVVRGFLTEPFRAGQSRIPTSNPSKLSADTPRKRGPLVESWDGERFAGRLPTVRAERDSPARFVHSRQGQRGSTEKERGLRSTRGRKRVGSITETQPSPQKTECWPGNGSRSFYLRISSRGCMT